MSPHCRRCCYDSQSDDSSDYSSDDNSYNSCDRKKSNIYCPKNKCKSCEKQKKSGLCKKCDKEKKKNNCTKCDKEIKCKKCEKPTPPIKPANENKPKNEQQSIFVTIKQYNECPKND